MHVIPRLLAGLVVCLASMLATGPSRAEFRGAEHLAGWWLSVDDVAFPPLWRAGAILAMEELLVIDRQGGFQSRMMMFQPPRAADCRDGNLCSDAPLLASGAVAVAGGDLVFSGVSHTPLVVDGAEADPVIRTRTLPAHPRWQVEGEATATSGLLRLQSAPGAEPRVFIKVEPDLLRRVRAGFLVQQASAVRYWRCYLGRVGGDLAASGRLDPHPSVRAYLGVASLAVTLDHLRELPIADDPDPALRPLFAHRPELPLVEAFADFPPPATAEERRSRALAWFVLEQVRQGQTWEAATAMVRQASGVADLDVPVEAEARAIWQRISQDVDLYERLFCHRP